MVNNPENPKLGDQKRLKKVQPGRTHPRSSFFPG